MEKYRILLPNDKAKAYNKISLLVLAVNLLAFGLLFFKKNTLAGYVAAVVMMLVIAVCLFSYASKNIKLQNKLTVFTIGLSAVAWLLAGDYMLTVLMALVAVVSFYTLQKPELIILESGISYPSFPKKFYNWKDVSRLMIKDEILSLDLKNNSLLQFKLLPELSTGLLADGFNEYCKKQIA